MNVQIQTFDICQLQQRRQCNASAVTNLATLSQQVKGNGLVIGSRGVSTEKADNGPYKEREKERERAIFPLTSSQKKNAFAAEKERERACTIHLPQRAR